MPRHTRPALPPRARVGCTRCGFTFPAVSPTAGVGLVAPRSALDCRTKSCAPPSFLGGGSLLLGHKGRMWGGLLISPSYPPIFAPNLAAPRERTHTLQLISDIASQTLHTQTLRMPRQACSPHSQRHLSRAAARRPPAHGGLLHKTSGQFTCRILLARCVSVETAERRCRHRTPSQIHHQHFNA